MADRIRKIIIRGYPLLFYLLLVGLFLKGEVFRVHYYGVSASFTSVKVLAVIFIGWWLLLLLCEKTKPHISRWLYPVLFLAVVQAVVSIDRMGTLGAELVLLVYIMWFFSVESVMRRTAVVINTIILLVILSGLVNLLNLYFHYCAGEQAIIEHYPFWRGKNALGLFLVISFCLSCSLRGRRFWSIAGALSALLLIPGIIFSYSRSAWIAGAVAAAGLAVFRFKRMLFLTVVCVVILLGISPEVVFQRTASVFSRGDTNTDQRIELWHNTLAMIQQRPVTGTGLGTFTEAYQSEFPDSFPGRGEGSRPARHAHNLYLQLLEETGILGLLLFLIMVTVGLFYGIRNIIKEEDVLVKSIRYGSLMGIFAFLVYSLFDCTVSWRFIGDSFLHINLIWLLLWVIILRPKDQFSCSIGI